MVFIVSGERGLLGRLGRGTWAKSVQHGTVMFCLFLFLVVRFRGCQEKRLDLKLPRY